MSRYSKIVVWIFLFIFVGCSKQPTKTTDDFSQKTFENEDILIIKALEYERLKKYSNAIETYKILYNKSHKLEYLKEVAKLSFMFFNNKKTYELLTKAIKKYPNELSFKRLLIGYYLNNKDYKKAEKMALELVNIKKSSKHLQILADIYLREKSYDLALKYFQSAFKIKKSKDILLDMVNLLYRFLDRKKDAISYLETYIRMNDASEYVYYALIDIYGKEKNIDGLISTYKKLYKKFKKDIYAKKAIELLMYKKDKKEAIKFLKKSGYNKELLLDIYMSDKDYKDAYIISKELYKETGKIDYLGKMAIFEYEFNKDNIDKNILKSISEKFDKVIEKMQSPLYLNYYGYLLIDYNLDIKKGIKLVKMALQKEPKSPFYLDSLAWGYYKLGECLKALDVMEKFIKETNEPEVIEHYEKIKQCLKKEVK